MSIKGYTNEGTYKKLKGIIETAALLGGVFTGILTIFADFLGAIGSGTGILLSVTIIYGLYEDIIKEKASKGKAAGNSKRWLFTSFWPTILPAWTARHNYKTDIDNK